MFFLILGIFLSQFFAVFAVESESMANTLHDGDVALTFRTGCEALRIGPPRRKDVIVFSEVSEGAAIDQSQMLIKRVVAIAGDRVRVACQSVILNGDRLNEPYSKWDRGCSKAASWPVDRSGTNEDFLVPVGTVFVLGDNRDASRDSRQFGPVPVSNVAGILILKLRTGLFSRH